MSAFVLDAMIYAGSVLMAYNIYRYLKFERSLRVQGGWDEEERILMLPIVLLGMFLLGYLAVVLFGSPDLIVAGILLGGSIFVLLMIVFLERVIKHIHELEQLSARLQLAEESNRSRTNFLSVMSHEIRTPMNAIIGIGSMLLKDESLPPEAHEKLEKLDENAHHLLALINDILDMSRIESGKMTLNDEEFSLAQLLGQVNATMQDRCSRKGLTYRPSVEGSVEEWYRGDDMKLRQVLDNVLENAVKFSDAPGAIDFSVQQTAAFENHRTLRFVVSDTGVGISEEFLPHVFSVFTQEDMATTNRYGGSGLGLAITKNIVEMMNGDIVVTSEKGVGTTFAITVTLEASSSALQGQSEQVLIEGLAGTGDADGKTGKVPLAESLVSMDAHAARDASLVNEAEPVPLEGLRVLLADDIDINAEIVADLLDLEGVTTERAENGREALDLFVASDSGYYDAVLMDVRMPVMDGLAAARAIRASDHPQAQRVPIIALTANAFDEDVQRSLQAGMNAHLSKPIDPDELYREVGRLVAQSRVE